MDNENHNNRLHILNSSNANPTKKIVILGASGSIGTSAINYIKEIHDVKVVGVSVHSSVNSLKTILQNKDILLASITDPFVYDNEIISIQKDFPAVKFYRGEEGSLEMLRDAKSSGVDTVLTAVVGASGVRVTLEAVRLKMKIALANKETLVTAGPAIIAEIETMRRNKEDLPVIIPVDSEHNSVFRLLDAMKPENYSKIILTASGGPLRNMSADQIKKVTRNEVLNHPTWSMGPKITVDSASMVNKGLEVIEAHYLFSIGYDDLSVIINKNSLVHAMVENTDGSYHLSASHPNMVFPIAHAIHFPEHVPVRHKVATIPEAWQPISFDPVDRERYPCFYLAMDVARAGGVMPAVFNAANEIAVELFLQSLIPFHRMKEIISETISGFEGQNGTDIELFIEIDREARAAARSHAKKLFTLNGA